MAHIGYPAALSPTRWAVSLGAPTTQAYRSIYTGAQAVLSRGVVLWGGAFTIGSLDVVRERELVNDLSTFLMSIADPGNTFDLPIPLLKQESRFSGVVNATGRVVAGSIAELELDTAAGGGNGFKLGDYFNLGRRAYQVLADQVGTFLRVSPSVIPAAFPAELTWQQVKFRARVDLGQSGELVLTASPEFTEPVTISWIEVVD